MEQKEEFNIFDSAIFRVLSRVLCRGSLLTFPKVLCIALRQKKHWWIESMTIQGNIVEQKTSNSSESPKMTSQKSEEQ